ncbi:hypothetical protein ACIRTB_23820 [Streptomyces sp. NPDC101158]|uniref:hypothetical protein n=1 Tax=Streptomyces sp. NPDC101158 TaxID=3366117 RepID=UPI00381801A1
MGAPHDFGAQEPTPGAPGRSLEASERAEYEALRRRAGLRHRRLRISLASVLLALAVLLAPVGVVAAWASSQINDVDRYEQTVAPLAHDPAVQDVIVDRVTDGVLARVDVHKISDALAGVLSDRDAPRFLVDAARSMDEQLKSGLATAVRYVVRKVVTSDAFAEAWDKANHGAHTAAMNVLTGEGGGAVEIKDDRLTLNVGVVVEEMQKQLIGTTLVDSEQIPGADTSVVLLRSDRLGEARDTVHWLGVLGPWLPVAVVGLAGLGIWAAPSHRRALMAAGTGISVMMCGLLVALSILRQVYLDTVAPVVQSQEAAAAVYDTLLRFLRQATATVLVVALIAVVAGYLCGPGRGAEAVRSAADQGLGAAGRALVRKGWDTGRAGDWLRTHRTLTTGTVIAAGALALFLWSYPTPAVVALMLLCAVGILAVLGVLAAAATTNDVVNR